MSASLHLLAIVANAIFTRLTDVLDILLKLGLAGDSSTDFNNWTLDNIKGTQNLSP